MIFHYLTIMPHGFSKKTEGLKPKFNPRSLNKGQPQQPITNAAGQQVDDSKIVTNLVAPTENVIGQGKKIPSYTPVKAAGEIPPHTFIPTPDGGPYKKRSGYNILPVPDTNKKNI